MSEDFQGYHITCNKCYKTLESTALRTSCNHILCLVCASNYFSNQTNCPCCHTKLSENQVSEVIIGIAPMPITQYLFQSLLQKNNWENIVDESHRIQEASLKIFAFVQQQLFESSSRTHLINEQQSCQLETTKSDMSKLIAQSMSQKSQSDQYTTELTHQLNTRDNELNELKQAYRDKKRQCDAWEKVYKNLKVKVDQQDQHSSIQKENQSNFIQTIPKHSSLSISIPATNTTTAHVHNSTKYSRYISHNDNHMNISNSNSSSSSNEYIPTDTQFLKPNASQCNNSYVKQVAHSYLNNKNSAPKLHKRGGLQNNNASAKYPVSKYPNHIQQESQYSNSIIHSNDNSITSPTPIYTGSVSNFFDQKD